MRAAAFALWPALHALDDNFINGSLADMQRVLSWQHGDAAHEAAIARCSTPDDRVKLHSQTWKRLLPTCPVLIIPDSHYQPF